MILDSCYRCKKVLPREGIQLENACVCPEGSLLGPGQTWTGTIRPRGPAFVDYASIVGTPHGMLPHSVSLFPLPPQIHLSPRIAIEPKLTLLDMARAAGPSPHLLPVVERWRALAFAKAVEDMKHGAVASYILPTKRSRWWRFRSWLANRILVMADAVRPDKSAEARWE